MPDDFDIICCKIDEEKEFLNAVSQEIWKNPELGYKETKAHDFLSNTFLKYGFHVEKHYLLNTAFKAEYVSKKGQDSGPAVAILLEYDALPEIGHACGHNLISESGLAAALAVKEVMDRNQTLTGKLVIIGTPAEEGGGGKIKLIEKGAFKGIDVALMVHPSTKCRASPTRLCRINGNIEYFGREAHAASAPWEGINALDAAVMCYNSISVLRQQIKPDHRIHVILKEGGVATNIIPSKSRLQFAIRSPTIGQLKQLKSKLEKCIKGAALSTGCDVDYKFEDSNCYENLISNKVLVNIYKKYGEKLGMQFEEGLDENTGSTDMGNVSHILPSVHPIYTIPSKGRNHTKEFADAAGLPTAQEPTLNAAKAMAMTIVSVLRYPGILKEAKEQFELDIAKDKELEFSQ